MEGDTVPDVRCPGCSGLDWARDGFALSADGPRIDAGRYAPPAEDAGRPWSCRACGQVLEDRHPLANALTQVQEAHWE